MELHLEVDGKEVPLVLQRADDVEPGLEDARVGIVAVIPELRDAPIRLEAVHIHHDLWLGWDLCRGGGMSGGGGIQSTDGLIA